MQKKQCGRKWRMQYEQCGHEQTVCKKRPRHFLIISLWEQCGTGTIQCGNGNTQNGQLSRWSGNSADENSFTRQTCIYPYGKQCGYERKTGQNSIRKFQRNSAETKQSSTISYDIPLEQCGIRGRMSREVEKGREKEGEWPQQTGKDLM